MVEWDLRSGYATPLIAVKQNYPVLHPPRRQEIGNYFQQSESETLYCSDPSCYHLNLENLSRMFYWDWICPGQFLQFSENLHYVAR